MEKIIGTINDDYFVHPAGMGFDFRNRADISFIMFLGAAPETTTIKKLLDFWKRYFLVSLKKHINVVVIGDRKLDTRHYGANYLGVDGVCNSIWELAKILHFLFYQKFSTKKIVVFGDCGGTIPAILSSTIIPYSSINLTTPYFEIHGNDNEFDTLLYTRWHGKEIVKNIFNSCQDYKNYFKTLNYFDEYTRNSNNILNLHWADTIIGTDLLFRHKANSLPKRQNIKITDHVVPKNIEGHLLLKYLIGTGEFYKLVLEEIKIQQAIIDSNSYQLMR